MARATLANRAGCLAPSDELECSMQAFVGQPGNGGLKEEKDQDEVFQAMQMITKDYIPYAGAGLRWLLGRRQQGGAWQ